MTDIKEKLNTSSVFSPLLTLYTLTYLALMVCDFVAKDGFEIPSGMMGMYVTLLGIYAADKQIKRWAGKEEPSTGGAFYVYCWLIFFLAAFVISSFWQEYTLPADLKSVTLQVLGIFFGSKASKKIYESKASDSQETLTREETVLEMIKDNGKVQRKDIMARLKLSDSTVGRLLEDMEKKGLIVQVGKYKDAYYIVAEQ